VIEAIRDGVRIETSEKRVRAYLAGRKVVDSAHPVMIWEKQAYPTYYFRREDVLAELIRTSEVRRSASRGDGVVHDLRTAETTATGAAIRYEDSPIEELRDLVRIDWDAMSEWFEEDEIVYTHPRNPYTRVDILPSSKHVRVEVAGVTVAETRQPRLLFETGLPTRYYVPLADVQMELFRPSSSESYCPYKGVAAYLTFMSADTIKPDIAWMYRTPLPESQKIAGLVGFYTERARIYVDGVLQELPRTALG
jgi:uncharacterized protein (DUF427 family)